MSKYKQLAQWLESHPEGLARVDRWLEGLAAGTDKRGMRRFAEEELAPLGCPITKKDQPSFLKWLRTHRSEEWAAVSRLKRGLGNPSAADVKRATPGVPASPPAAKVRLDDHVFARSDSDVRALEKATDFVITCAQNNTEPEWDFLRALERYVKDRGARLIVIPMRYANPTSKRDPQEERGEDYWWHEALHDYLIENELRVHPHLRIMGDVRIQATAVHPLSGLESRSRDASAIYGHPQVAMQTVATPQHRLPKLLYTTGSVTKKNYSRTKQGNLGAFHHTHGAVVAEIRGDVFFLREINWDGETFHDLDRAYAADCKIEGVSVEALVTGDEHVWFHCPEVRHATYDGRGSICEVLRPPVIVRHDVLDCYSVSPHHNRNSITRAIKAANGRDSLQRELDDTIRFIEQTTPSDAENVIVSSNHHDHLLRWLEAGEAHVEPCNARLYHELKYRVLAAAQFGPGGAVPPDPFALYAREQIGVPTRFLGPDDSFQVCGVELGMHGHRGPNGTRGSLRAFSKIGTRSMVGHIHSPGIYQGAYGVGTSSQLRLEYNAGPSSWLNTHGVVHQNGKRQLIHVVSGRWHG